MEDVESRFMHFLQPIRDLTKNWEVDVATQLGEYLEELDQICISFDGGKTTMNFIEAALLIQGSACIYSKKVEYLYTLVYQALDFISNKKREKQPTSIGVDGTDGDVSARPGTAEEEEEFLSLDDIQQASRANMDLRDDQQHNTVAVVPLTPMALVPPEESDKKDNPLFSRKGELLASRKDFRMNTCTPHHSGLFMLELAGLSPIRCQAGRDGGWDRGHPTGTQSLVPTAGSVPMEVSACETPVQALDFSGERTGAANPADDHEEGGEGFLADIPEEGQEGPSDGAEEHIAHQTSAPQSKGYALRERFPDLEDNPHLKDTWDPWQSLDPFSSSENKPFKKGRPFTVPRGLEDLSRGKRKRRPSSMLQDFVSWFSSSEPNQPGNQRNRRKGCTFADLEILYWKNAKERLVAQRKLQKRMAPFVGLQLIELGALEVDREEEEEEEDFDAGAADDGAEDFVADEEIPPLETSGRVPDGVADPGDIPSSLSYEELVNKNVELFMAHSQKYARETVLSRRVRDWEEMMGPQLEEQEARAAFDIHSYGDQLVSRFSRVGKWHSFASLLAGQPAFEVCRAMLASLQLANDYTVEISQQPGLEEAVDTMALRLLTQERAHQRFQTYTAPSLSKQ